MPLYSPGSDELVAQVQAVAERYHRRLVDTGLRVDVLEVRPRTDEAGEVLEDHALKHGGYPCFATIQILGPKDRGANRGDVLLCVDAYRWPELDELTQVAVLDHELTHLELVTDDEGTVRYDDYGRPKLRMRLHDICHGWFSEVAKRHKGHSIEVQQATTMITEHEEFIPGISVAATARKAG
jgi:hypothetical protein